MSGTIGFVVAMKQEARPFLRATGAERQAAPGGFETFRFERDGHACVLVRSGVGRRKAGEAVAALVDAVRPSLLVSFGVSGAAADDLSVGDLVLITEVCALDDGALGPAVPLAAWPETASEAARQAAVARGQRCVTATAVTTHGETALPAGIALATSVLALATSVLAPATSVLALATSVLALDMETSAIVAAATTRGIPVLALRAISDTPGQPLPFEISRIVDAQGKLRISRLLAAVVRRPGLVRALARTGRNMRTAMEVLVSALLAALPATLDLPGGAPTLR